MAAARLDKKGQPFYGAVEVEEYYLSDVISDINHYLWILTNPCKVNDIPYHFKGFWNEQGLREKHGELKCVGVETMICALYELRKQIEMNFKREAHVKDCNFELRQSIRHDFSEYIALLTQAYPNRWPFDMTDVSKKERFIYFLALINLNPFKYCHPDRDTKQALITALHRKAKSFELVFAADQSIYPKALLDPVSPEPDPDIALLFADEKAVPELTPAAKEKMIEDTKALYLNSFGRDLHYCIQALTPKPDFKNRAYDAVNYFLSAMSRNGMNPFPYGVYRETLVGVMTYFDMNLFYYENQDCPGELLRDLKQKQEKLAQEVVNRPTQSSRQA